MPEARTRGTPRKGAKPHLQSRPEDAKPEEAQRRLDVAAELVLALLDDGLPHTRSEIGAFAREHGITDSQLGAIKRAYSIKHVRVQPGSENGLGRSRFAWVKEKGQATTGTR